MKILVTGGAGYIGSHAVKHLNQNGHETVVVDNLSRGHGWAARWGRLEQIDLLDFPALKEVLARHRPDAVMHFAAYALVGESMQRPELYYRNNFVGSLNLLEAMHLTGVDKLVFSSTCATYGNPQTPCLDEEHPQAPVNPYGHSKLMTEQAIADFRHSYGLKACCLRYFNACGCDPDGELGEVHDPETHLIPCIFNALLANRPLQLYGQDYPTPDGTCVRDYVHVLDLASAHRLALEKLSRGAALRPAYNLGTGRGHSVREVIAVVEKVTGRKVEVSVSQRRPGDPPSLVATCQLAQADLNWRPQWTDLEQTVASAWRWHCQYFCQTH
ncbi:UDP-glucose 4-epimerase GalE [bacterium]|nr:UDP-glucose 4-epimerase GalE [bacterium]